MQLNALELWNALQPTRYELVSSMPEELAQGGCFTALASADEMHLQTLIEAVSALGLIEWTNNAWVHRTVAYVVNSFFKLFADHDVFVLVFFEPLAQIVFLDLELLVLLDGAQQQHIPRLRLYFNLIHKFLDFLLLGQESDMLSLISGLSVYQLISLSVDQLIN